MTQITKQQILQTSEKTELRARQKLKTDTKVFKCNSMRNASSETSFRPNKLYKLFKRHMRDVFQTKLIELDTRELSFFRIHYYGSLCLFVWIKF